MDGVLNILKPPGMTSHDVVAYIRRLLATKKVGHTGTLDPDVAGVLPVCIGKATRIVDYLTDRDKEYRGEITFGIVTDTADIAGVVTKTCDASDLTKSRVEEIMNGFIGAQQQIPPMVSAVKVNGKKLYQYAREGLEIPREPRQIFIRQLKIIKVEGFGTSHPKVLFHVVCSKGTYIRTLCADIGDMAGCGATMSYLLRTRSGAFTIDQALTLEEINDFALAGTIDKYMMPVSRALTGIPKVVIFDELAAKVKNGNRIFAPGVKATPEGIKEGDRVGLWDSAGNLLAIASAFLDESDTNRVHYQPVKVF